MIDNFVATLVYGLIAVGVFVVAVGLALPWSLTVALAFYGVVVLGVCLTLVGYSNFWYFREKRRGNF